MNICRSIFMQKLSKLVKTGSDVEEVINEQQLPENEVESALNCAFIGVGGGGGKLAKSFLDLGYHKTLLINTTAFQKKDT